MSVYGLANLTIEVRFPAEDFSSSLCVQTALEPTKPPVQWIPGFPSLGLKRGRGVTLTTHLHLVPSRSYTSFPPSAFVACSGAALSFYSGPSYILIEQPSRPFSLPLSVSHPVL
jgi:hypothetical protein